MKSCCQLAFKYKAVWMNGFLGERLYLRLGTFFFARHFFNLEHSASNVEVALRKRHFYPGFTEFRSNGKIYVAAVTTGTRAHFTAPDYELKVDRVLAKFFEKHARCWFLESIPIFAGDGQ